MNLTLAQFHDESKLADALAPYVKLFDGDTTIESRREAARVTIVNHDLQFARRLFALAYGQTVR